MSGNFRSGFTWKEVADILHVSQIPNAAIFRREIKRQKKGRLRARRAPIGAKEAQRACLAGLGCSLRLERALTAGTKLCRFSVYRKCI